MSEGDRKPTGEARARAVRALAEDLAGRRGPLMPIIHRVNDAMGCITAEDEAVVANVLNLSVADVHGVVSFYKDFRSVPDADCHVQLCRGEACQSVGAAHLVDHAQKRFSTRLGAQSPDGGVGLEEVFCFGNCALGPTVTVNGELHGRMTPDRLDHLVDSATRRPVGSQP